VSPISSSQAAINTESGLVSVEPFRAAVVAGATARLLTHRMPAAIGGSTLATTVLFVPRGLTPSGGWPIVVWSHGTTTGGQKRRAPSLSATLDGGLTADGSVTGYVRVIESFVVAGYAVVAPDFEGLGVAAQNPHPYYSSSSLSRSLVHGVQAAHQADESLSTRWASVGHSEGGHGALAAEMHSDEAPGLTHVGAVAFAPFTSVGAIVEHNGDQVTLDPTNALQYLVQQNFNVALMAAGLRALNPDFDYGSVMGPDLERLMPSVLTKGSVDIVADITDAISGRSSALFTGFKPNWDQAADVHQFMAENDPALVEGFTVQRPTLVIQGANDISVPEHLTSAFTDRLSRAGAPITYRKYAAADHFTIVDQGRSEALAFLLPLLSD